MILTQSDLFLLSQSAISAAYQAAAIISNYAARPVAVKNKIAGESLASQVVTEVDLLCQEIILQTLQPTCQIYDLALLSEEIPDDQSRFEKDYFWCIDPLDGTLPFIENTNGYCVSIALVAKTGESIIGVIYDPVAQALYHAIKGQGAIKNGKQWFLNKSKYQQDQPLTMIADRSFKHYQQYHGILKSVEKLSEKLNLKGIKSIIYGGGAMNACWVIENAPACYFKLPKKGNGGGSLWDYAASSCLINEAGGVVSDIYGKPLDLNRQDSTFLNHRGILYTSDKQLSRLIQDMCQQFI